MDPSIDLRRRIHDAVARGSSTSLELAFDLGIVLAEDAWRAWTQEVRDEDGKPILLPFASFFDWASHDLGRHHSRSHVYALAKVGVTFRPIKDKVTKAFAERKPNAGIRHLIELTTAIEGGLSRIDAFKHIIDDAPLPEAHDTSKQKPVDDEHFVQVKLLVRKGDWAIMKKGLLYEAVREGHGNISDALISLAIGLAVDPQKQELPAWAARWKEQIDKDEFYCHLCKRIPKEATPHHICQQSIAQGRGPVVILCLSPCHEIVTGNEDKYGRLWLGTKKYDRMMMEFRSSREPTDGEER